MRNFIVKIPGVLATIGALSLVVLMVMTVSDIFGRSSGLYYPMGLIELSQITLILVGFMCFPYKFMKDGQIIVDLFTHNLSPRTNSRIDSIWLIVAGIFFLSLMHPMYEAGVDLHNMGQRTSELFWSPLVMTIPAVVGSFFSGVTCLVLGIRRLNDRLFDDDSW